MDLAQDTLLQLEHRPIELGRIRTGEKVTKMRNGKEVEYPAKLDTFRLTSGSQALLEAAASLYGGTVTPWEDAPDEGYFELLTTSRELRVLIPRDLRTVSQAYEYWQGGTCERRCDGTVEQITDGPCLCDDDRLCKPVTRISLMLPDVPGLGVWRLDSGGWHAATSLPATIGLLKQLSTAAWIPAILRLEQRSKKAREADGKVVTHRFAVPVLDLPNLTIGRVVASQNGAPVPSLEAGPRQAPPTAAERVAERRAAIEATSGPPPLAPREDGSGQGQAGAVVPPPRDDDPPLPAEPAGRDIAPSSRRTGDSPPKSRIAPDGDGPAPHGRDDTRLNAPEFASGVSAGEIGARAGSSEPHAAGRSVTSDPAVNQGGDAVASDDQGAADPAREPCGAVSALGSEPCWKRRGHGGSHRSKDAVWQD